MSDSALLLKYGAFLATFDGKKEFCCITSHVHISSCESLMGRERERSKNYSEADPAISRHRMES